MGFCEAWISGLRRRRITLGDAALGGAKSGCFGYVWVEILVWVGLG